LRENKKGGNDTSKVKIIENPDFLKPHAKTKVTFMGNITEVMTCEKQSNGSPCKKIDKDHYIDLRTGELFEYEHSENRGENLHGIRHTLNRIRALINTNVTEPLNCRWVTLTYRQEENTPMTDTKKLYSDYFKFWKRFCYWCKTNGYGKPEYISVIEPQGSGAWHVHSFFIWQKKAPFIPNDKIAELWGQGFTKTKQPQDCDNVGAYFSAYLGDMPLDEVQHMSKDKQLQALSATGQVDEKGFADDAGAVKKKKFVKGGRLYLYPPGMNIIRSSKGVKQPEVEYMSRETAQKKVSSAKETFSCAYAIVGDDGQVVNRITKAYYNSKRK